MKRDLELTRRLMLALENDDEIHFEGVGDRDIVYHMKLLNDAGFLLSSTELITYVNGEIDTTSGLYQLSWSGQEYLQALKDDTIWNKTKETAGKVGSWTFDLVKQIAIELAKEEVKKLGIHL